MQIDRVDVSGKAVAHQVMNDAAAEFGLAVRGAEHGQRTRMQNALDIDAWGGAGGLAQGGM